MYGDQFKIKAQLLTDWINSYYQKIRSYPVRSQLKYGDVAALLPKHLPLEAESFASIIADLDKVVLPGLTHWQHPRFFGYFPANVSEASVLGEYLSAALGVQGMLWSTSPALTEIEITVCDWLREAMGFGSEFKGVIQDAASIATLVAMVTARERQTLGETKNEGLWHHRPMVIYCSEEAHSSVEKSACLAGFGAKYVRKIPVDINSQMQTTLLEAAIFDDLKNNLQPLMVVGALGTTGLCAIDPLDKIADICQQHKLWFHIDGAYAGSALILDDFRARHRAAINRADSFVFNPHKWLMTNFDCSVYFFKDDLALTNSMSILPEYLRTPEDSNVRNLRDYGPGLGRRFRALKLWFVLRSYGLNGLKEKLHLHLDMAHRVRSFLRESGLFEVITDDSALNLICFRLRNPSVNLLHFLEEINSEGFMFMSHGIIHNQFYLRLVVGQSDLTHADVDESIDYLIRKARFLEKTKI
jgi:aromatic-L-amino-acid decarboxylase